MSPGPDSGQGGSRSRRPSMESSGTGGSKHPRPTPLADIGEDVVLDSADRQPAGQQRQHHRNGGDSRVRVLPTNHWEIGVVIG